MRGTNGQPAHNKVTTLTNWNNNLADLYQYSTANGTAIYGYHSTGTENQQWHLWDQGGGYFLIENRYTERSGLTGANARVLDYNFSNDTARSHQGERQRVRVRQPALAVPRHSQPPRLVQHPQQAGRPVPERPHGRGPVDGPSCTTADGLDSMQWKLQ
ncbi:RICIN domain-containing protein [Streptomyces sp. TLI_146]|uniref:RICIN domain-containing protein n=1 Tax=Streptomyces sp. TLI_146 TaxID=1938858 RepID=UPI000CB28A83|nr:RICIN domain-containing protein [Streptomyces sp. TLI_146]PKV83218.1 ricin-type beta-trefoil lectin protein [Streptomyces sp. TLI_146]